MAYIADITEAHGALIWDSDPQQFVENGVEIIFNQSIVYDNWSPDPPKPSWVEGERSIILT